MCVHIAFGAARTTAVPTTKRALVRYENRSLPTLTSHSVSFLRRFFPLLRIFFDAFFSGAVRLELHHVRMYNASVMYLTRARWCWCAQSFLLCELEMKSAAFLFSFASRFSRNENGKKKKNANRKWKRKTSFCTHTHSLTATSSLYVFAAARATSKRLNNMNSLGWPPQTPPFFFLLSQFSAIVSSWAFLLGAFEWARRCARLAFVNESRAHDCRVCRLVLMVRHNYK